MNAVKRRKELEDKKKFDSSDLKSAKGGGENQAIRSVN